MAYNEQSLEKKTRSSKKPKNKFGLYCKELRRLLNINITQAAEAIGVSQPYLTQLENGTEPLTTNTLLKCLKGYASLGNISVETKLELLYEMLELMETIEIDLSQVTIIHRENLLRLIAELLLNEQYPSDAWGSLPWNIVSGYVRGLQAIPPVLYDSYRIVSKLVIEPVVNAPDTPTENDT
ncbi:MAG: helix-turn-helix transcriptional regulator [Treponema sp.]|nr:helix-turn-helix transcriptional regulator [Treponema sp.]